MKSKWAAGLLAFLVPGTGHLYLGLMFRGITIMLLLAFNVSAIVFAATEYGKSALPIVLLSLLLPIVYFYNLFDAIRQTEIVNRRTAMEHYSGRHDPFAPMAREGMQRISTSWIFIIAFFALIITAVGSGRRLVHWSFQTSGSLLGAFVLIGIGVFLWYREMRDGHDGEN